MSVADVTDGRFADTDPAFTGDGLYLAFLSRRSFDPVYDAHYFDQSIPLGSRPYLVPLAATTPSPFAPLLDGRPVTLDGDSGKDEDQDDSERAVVTVDPDDLTSRVVSVPVAEARYTALHAVKGGLAWLREPVSGALGEGTAGPDDDGPRPALERFDLTKRTCTELTDEVDWFTVSGDGTRLVVGDGDEVRVLPSERKEDDGESGAPLVVDLARARFLADPPALWRHAYDELGRLMRRVFWTPDMAGVDWDGVLDRYRPLLDRISGASDFADVLSEVAGELGTSHAYVSQADDGGGRGGDGMAPVGQLGADIERDPDGAWRLARVVPGESSDPKAASPLAAPGVAVRPGDELLAVDGQPVDPVAGPGPRLAGVAGKPVELTVRADRALPRRVVVTPLPDDRRLRYQDWVAGRRRLVRELGAGRLGYLHIPDMMGEGWAHFHRDLRTEMRCDALIVDVRGNRGGHVSQLVVEKLTRRIIGWDVPRGLLPETYPGDAPRGPLVALADEFAGSDGDIVTAAIRLLGLGPVVGTRTWGGVIGIEGLPGHLLADGTRVTVPQYAFWFERYGWSVENHGVDPDVEVLITPDDWAAGRDPQLETAVRIAIEALETHPPVSPPDLSTRPSRVRPPLPPRTAP
jgi:tricorn protease